MKGWRVLLASVMGVVAAASLSAQASGGNVASGRDLYMKYTCYACHGFSGQNGPGARLVPMKLTTAAFTAYVRNPRTRQMPSYSTKVLSDSQLGNIHAYIKTLPDSPPAASIRALDQFKEK